MARALGVLALAAIIAAAACSPGRSASTEKPGRSAAAQRGASATESSRDPDFPRAVPTPPTPVPRPQLHQETYVEGLAMPVAFEFAPDGRMFVAELDGRIRLVEGGALRPEPIITLPTTKGLEQGALGLALDPDFSRTHQFFVLYSEPRPGTNDPRRNRLVRLTESGGRGVDQQVILDNLPIGKPSPENVNGDHNGGRIGFGPDGKLYVAMGDVAQRTAALKLENPHGKLLRLNPDGSIPADNPFPGQAAYATGFRSPFGLDFHPLTGLPYVTDNGPQGHDEVNRVVARGNYGWPEVAGRSTKNDTAYVDPVWESGLERLGPTGLAFYTGSLMPEFQNDLFFCDWNTGSLWRLRLEPPDYGRSGNPEVVAQPCRLYVRTGPDGALYFSDHHAIYRLAP